MAEKYTPTTEQVRDIYADWIAERRSGPAAHTAEAEFDRWLAAHDAEVKAEALRKFARDMLDRYPEDVFAKPTRESYAKVHEMLTAQGLALDCYSADLFRRAAAQAMRAADEMEAAETEATR